MENQSSSADFIERKAEKEPKRKSSGSNLLSSRPGPQTTGLIDWLTTIDHKKVGFMYAAAALICLIPGAFKVLQIAHSESIFLTKTENNQLFTMHGMTMVYLAVMPLSVALFNFVIPLQIGARNVALPRINTLSLWCYIAGAIILNMSWFFQEGAPVIGWFEHLPVTLKVPHGDIGMSTDFWVIGLLLLGFATLLTSFNIITTIINMRCPGMTMMRLPVFTWMALFTAFLMILAVPAITAALIKLMFDRQFGTLFFENAVGGKTIFWQHMFWIFGHPELHILILPAMGIISEIIPTFSRKPLFGYGGIIFSGVMIGFLGFTVWSHHMFDTGLGTIAISGFSILTTLIVLPTGVMIFNWIGTLWGGSIRYTTPMLFAVGFITMFLLFGYTLITHSTLTVDVPIQKSYPAIAHFHCILIGSSIFALLAGFYYWIPKLTGTMLSDKFGKFCFTLIFAGFNLTFLPMHFLGMDQITIRTDIYQTGKGWDDPNMLATIGALLLGFGILFSSLQILNSVINRKKHPKAGNDPWDARTLEWTIPSPAPVYNFSKTPIVKRRDQHWHDKNGPTEEHREFEPENPRGVRMPDRSWWPLFSGIGIFLLGIGLITRKLMFHLPGGDTWELNFELLIFGTGVVLLSIMFWAIEGRGGQYFQPAENEANCKND